MKTDEDDEFERIARENKLKSSGVDCCTYDCVQGRDCPVRQAKWVGLSKEETQRIVGDDRYTSLIKDVVTIVETLLRRKNT
jgi:hypothetical protein